MMREAHQSMRVAHCRRCEASSLRNLGFGGRSEPPNGVQGRSPGKFLHYSIPETPIQRISGT